MSNTTSHSNGNNTNGGKGQNYELVATRDFQPPTHIQLQAEKSKKEESGCCCRLLKNKCCIACLVILALLVTVVLGVIVTISIMLKEDKNGSEYRFVNYTYRSYYSEENNSSLSIDVIVDSDLEPDLGSDSPKRIADHCSDDYNRTLAEIRRPVSKFSEHIDLNLWELPAEVAEEVFVYMPGHDRVGRPIFVIPIGYWDLKKVLTNGDSKEREQALDIFFDQLHLRVYHSCLQACQQDFVMITDMNNYSYGQFWSWTTTAYIMKLAKNFAEPLENAAYGYILNLDTVSRLLINAVKPILGFLLDRLTSFGTDKEEYAAVMLEKIAPDQLPELYGGTQTNHPGHST